MDEMCKKLPDAGLLHQDLRNMVTLTERGRHFAEWLIENGHKAIFFSSTIGGWGERPSGWPPMPQPVWQEAVENIDAGNVSSDAGRGDLPK